MTSFTGTSVAILTVLLGACASAPQLRPARPTSVQMDLSEFRRVWIAGFVTSDNRDIDVNAELVRLLRDELKSRTASQVVETAPLAFGTEDEFANRERWEKLGEEHGAPLIVTGIVRLEAIAPIYSERGGGRSPSYQSRRGLSLTPTFVFIDGLTGEIVASERLDKVRVHGTDPRTSTLSLFFQLMDRVMPQFLQTMGLEQASLTRRRVI